MNAIVASLYTIVAKRDALLETPSQLAEIKAVPLGMMSALLGPMKTLNRLLILVGATVWLGAAPAVTTRRIDLNHATVTQLMSLPGIGKKRAAEIVEYRRCRPFRRAYELLKLPGIGRRTYRKLKSRIAVTPRPKHRQCTGNTGKSPARP